MSVASVVAELTGALRPDQVIVPGSGADESWRVFNAAVDHEPIVVVRCAGVVDVQVAVRVARTHGLPLSVRGGGHDWAGRALRHGGLVLDLTAMREVEVDTDARIATVAGGAKSGDVITAGTPHDLVAVTGTIGHVGMAGMSLGGGYGPLNGRFGLALDNIVGAEVVLADGRVVIADEHREPELFWALRGGGGNFGVVTSLRIRLHSLAQLLAGFIVYPWSQATQVLSALPELLAAAPDELTVLSGVMPGPDGSPTVLLSPAWSGPINDGDRHIANLHRLGSPMMAQVGPMPYQAMLGLFDSQVVPGLHNTVRTRTVAGHTPEIVAALVAAGDTKTSPISAIGLHHFHGAATRVAQQSTAFGIRRPHFSVEIAALWQPGDDAARHREWADATSTAIAAHALPGGYANMLGPDHHDQIAQAYGPNAARLRAAKDRYDPERVFTAIPLPLGDQ
ncbi:FAD-binding oxidoreductase [Kibdelosporangium philippinense]|uniref:FAD-binding oxidoreductase n=1 Tax=Kibdelosporangium philippinense TaxID=211113 RepID=A0ABS8ZHL3_9PSEU|nr:FAD-binding oxidoreductase [Kibdelosporangium philippinense]MCE7007296.1 FAD-binding oxidoreductase [Kibdelosporangium philippinense]